MKAKGGLARHTLPRRERPGASLSSQLEQCRAHPDEPREPEHAEPSRTAAPSREEPCRDHGDDDALPARRALPRGHVSGEPDIRPDRDPNHREEHCAAEAHPRLALRRPGASRRDERDQGSHREREPDPQSLGALGQDERGHREPERGREPQGEETDGVSHSGGAEGAARGDDATAISTARMGATTPQYHHSSERPRSRMDPVS